MLKIPNSIFESISNRDLLNAYSHPQKLFLLFSPNNASRGGYSINEVDKIFIIVGFIVVLFAKGIDAIAEHNFPMKIVREYLMHNLLFPFG